MVTELLDSVTIRLLFLIKLAFGVQRNSSIPSWGSTGLALPSWEVNTGVGFTGQLRAFLKHGRL